MPSPDTAGLAGGPVEERWEDDSSGERARATTNRSVEKAVFSCRFRSNPNLKPNLIDI